MVITNAWQMLGVSAAYFIMFLLLPYYLFNLHRRPEGFLPKVFFTLCLSTLQMIASVYVLSFLRILSSPTLLLLILVEAALIFWRTRRQPVMYHVRKLHNFFLRVHGGYYKPRVMLRKTWLRALGLLYRVWVDVIKKNPVYCLAITVCFAYGLGIRAWPLVIHSPYGVSDLYVYTEWIKAMFENRIFSAGVYFFGMHNMIAGMALLLFVDVVTLIRMLGIAYTVITMLGLLWVFGKIFSSKSTVVVAMAVFCGILTYLENSYFRHSFAVAQEFSQMFWIIGSGFYLEYLFEKRRFSLVGFGIALCCATLAHYYGVLILAFFCIAYAVVYLPRFFEDRCRVLWALFRVVAVAIVLGLLPMGIGMLLGYPLHGSFAWGLGVVSSGTEAAQVQQDVGLWERLIEGLDISYTLERGVPVLVSLALSGIMLCVRRMREAGRRLMGLSIFQAILYLQIIAVPLGFPTLLDHWRAAMFFTMLVGGNYAAPIAFFSELSQRVRKTMVGVAASLLVGLLVMRYGLKPVAEAKYVQLDGATRAYYSIRQEYPNGTWTIVSPVEDTSIVKGVGYHYEMYDFIVDMEDYDPETEIEIPTQYVFFMVEKIPVMYENAAGLEVSLPSYPIEEDHARLPLPDVRDDPWADKNEAYHTHELRHVLEAKAYAWTKAFAQHFPDDMTIYYEDDEMVIYRYKQNMYQLTNFSIYYGYNPYPR